MAEQGVVGITGIDTRALTKHLRDHGIQVGTITIEGEPGPLLMKTPRSPSICSKG